MAAREPIFCMGLLEARIRLEHILGDLQKFNLDLGVGYIASAKKLQGLLEEIYEEVESIQRKVKI